MPTTFTDTEETGDAAGDLKAEGERPQSDFALTDSRHHKHTSSVSVPASTFLIVKDIKLKL